jgi:hypothetical protein
MKMKPEGCGGISRVQQRESSSKCANVGPGSATIRILIRLIRTLLLWLLQIRRLPRPAPAPPPPWRGLIRLPRPLPRCTKLPGGQRRPSLQPSGRTGGRRGWGKPSGMGLGPSPGTRPLVFRLACPEARRLSPLGGIPELHGGRRQLERAQL